MTISRMQQPRQMYQEGGIMPRLNQLGSDVSSAEQMLQGINQRLESAESSLGEGGVGQDVTGNNPMNIAYLTQRPALGVLKRPLPSDSPSTLSSVQTPDPFFGNANMPSELGPALSPMSSAMRNMAAGGGMMGRQMYGLGSLVKSITKPFKKVAKGVKKIAKSPVGKAAMLYFGGNLLQGNPMFGNPFTGRITDFIAAKGLPSFMKNEGAKKFFGKIGDVAMDVGIGSLVAGGLDAFQRRNLPEDTSIGGRSREDIQEVLDGMRKNYENLGYSDGEIDLLIEQYANQNYPGYLRAEGGRIGYAMGSPEENAIQAAGIEGLPLNKNPAGITELDLRETGGFIPPVGVKEKADDIPAMLSNNEFVMTADAVREFGDGDVDKGAERMYAMMKTLENGGRV